MRRRPLSAQTGFSLRNHGRLLDFAPLYVENVLVNSDTANEVVGKGFANVALEPQHLLSWKISGKMQCTDAQGDCIEQYNVYPESTC